MKRMIMSSSFLPTAVAAAVASLTSIQAAVIISASSVNPTTDAYDQYQFTAGGTVDNGQDYSDNGGPPGQTFTTPSGSQFELTQIGFKGSGQADGSISQSGWGFRISSVTGNTLTPLATYTPAQTGANFGLTSSSWLLLTFNLGDILTLQPSTTYAIEAYSDGRWWGFGEAVASSYTGGNAFNSNSGQRNFTGTTINNRDRDRAFYANLNAVPEPQAALLTLVSAGLLLRRKR